MSGPVKKKVAWLGLGLAVGGVLLLGLASPFTLSPSKGVLSPPPFTLSPSKGVLDTRTGFDKLSLNSKLSLNGVNPADPSTTLRVPLDQAHVSQNADGYVTQLSGFKTPPQDGRPAEIAQQFVAQNRDQLKMPSWLNLQPVPDVSDLPSPFKVVAFNPSVDSLPLFSASVKVALDGQGSVVALNSDPVPTQRSKGSFVVSESRARELLSARGAVLASLEQGYYPSIDVVTPAWRAVTSASATQPPREIYLDATTGVVLLSSSLQHNFRSVIRRR